MPPSSFSREDLEKINPLLKAKRERHEKRVASRGIPHNPEQLRQVQADIHRAYELLELPEKALEATHPSIASRYDKVLEKLRADRDELIQASTCQKAIRPLKQFQGKSKMALALLQALKIAIDRPLFDQLTNHHFPLPQQRDNS